MNTSTRKGAKLGYVIEIVTPRGLAYFQYTHQHPMFGGLIRVLQGTYSERPSNLSELASLPEKYVIFFPVRAAVARGLVTVVAHEAIPEHARSFPLFKMGRPSNWWLWDGQREWQVGQLTPEQRKLPVRAIWNDTMLASRIASGWSPEDMAVEPS